MRRNAREDKIYSPDGREKIFREEPSRETQRERERDENAERSWPLLPGSSKALSDDEDKKNCV